MQYQGYKREKNEAAAERAAQPQRMNRTGIPRPMLQRFEALSGCSFDDVRVHYQSDRPARLQALAYTQANHVYLGPGQEQHLGHELGHVVQQRPLEASARSKATPH